jgi:signal transduction histidine kinase
LPLGILLGLAMYFAALRLPRPRSIVLALAVAAALGATVAYSAFMIAHTPVASEAVENLVPLAGGWFIADSVAARRRYLAGLAAQAERERAGEIREERVRIAREMHDVVAHRVSLMVVHSGALERVVHKDPEKAAASARLMGDIGRQALDELRQILGVLRTVEPEDPEEAGGVSAVSAAGAGAGGAGAASSAAPVTAPAPAATCPTDYASTGLADLAKLVDESRAAGLGVRFTLGGARRELTSEAEQTAYRVVQEALTNVLKHAPGADVEVVVAYVPGGVALAVSNGCPPAVTADTGPARADLPSGGNGLVGMRERVTALGGAFAAGPTAEGGFRVEARLLAAG